MMYLSCGADMDSLPLCVCVWAGKEGGGAQGHCQGIRKEGPREREGKRGCRMAGGVLHSASSPSASLHLLFAHPPRLGHACQGPVTDGAWVHVCVCICRCRLACGCQRSGTWSRPPPASQSNTNKLPGACLFHLSPVTFSAKQTHPQHQRANLQLL